MRPKVSEDSAGKSIENRKEEDVCEGIDDVEAQDELEEDDELDKDSDADNDVLPVEDDEDESISGMTSGNL